MYSLPVNGALWTIKVEVAFYLFLPLVIFLIEKINSKKGKNIFLGLCYFLSVAWKIFFEYIGNLKGSPTIADIGHQFPGFVSYFAVGILFVYNWDFFTRNLNKIVIPSFFVFALHYVTKTEILLPFALSVLTMWFGLRLAVLANLSGNKDFSYGMYLTHFPIIQVCVYLGFFGKLPVFTMFLVNAAAFLCAVLLSKIDNIGINNKKQIIQSAQEISNGK